MEKRTSIIIGAAIVVGLGLQAILLGSSIQRFRKEDRTISVKGFAEREVKADFSVWSIKTRVAGNDLALGSRSIDEAKIKVVNFLLKNGVKPSEIVQKDLVVNDRKAQEYSNYNEASGFRYLIDKTIQVRSTNVENIQKISRMTDELLKAGVVLTSANEYGGSSVKYVFTKLNDIKPDMLSEATVNAKNAAIRFANESQTKLGKMKHASQGIFSIVDRDESLSGQAEGGGGSGTNDLYKRIKVVVGVEYSIE
ncbi:SIMPL domain-containing protein [uncultured Acetobacteroides sp.]|uniref:SIMPL domain-containing protein n=1 Tax=uncultured Acetobacteroides sp. TaxID=1760811 RepID=UPI0029F52456|nr:SIMPL domain-containing protein [uncultured Acetobacteroides sp.]